MQLKSMSYKAHKRIFAVFMVTALILTNVAAARIVKAESLPIEELQADSEMQSKISVSNEVKKDENSLLASNPYDRLEVENFDGSYGGVVAEACSDGTQNLGGIQNGCYTYYNDVNFGSTGTKSVIFRASSGTGGGTIEIRLGSPTGQLVGTCKIDSTGSWANYKNFYAEIGKITGVQKLYLVYKGSGYLFNLNWVQFYGAPTQSITGVTIDNLNPKIGDTLHAIVSPSGAMVSYSWRVNGIEKSKNETYTVSIADIGKQIAVQITGIANYSGQLTSSLTSVVLGINYGLDFDQVAYDGFTSFINKYYTYDTVNRVYRFVKDYWTEAEMFEIVIDAYNHTGDTRYKNMINELYEGFLVDWKHQEINGWWAGNNFNDDIMWMVIACTRAYMATGDSKYLNKAKINFDNTYARAWSSDLGGGLWWNIDKQSKNSCVNGPATIAACLLGECLNDESYFTKAKAIYEWQRANLYEPNTGRVYDDYNINGTKSTWASTYNQGTFIGGCTLLYEHFGISQYLNDAITTANYTMNDMYQCQVMNNEENADVLQGFKGILTRWLNYLTVNHNQIQFAEWLQYNTWTAWNNRNSSGITSTQWGRKTTDSETISAWNASAAVALYQNTANTTNMIKDAYAVIEAENFDSCNTIITENASEGSKNIGYVKNGSYSVYRNVNFSNIQPTNAEFRVSSAASGGTIEIRLGSLNGSLIGSCQVSNTGSWNNWTTVTAPINQSVSGIQDIFLVYKSNYEYTFNVNWFRFNTETPVKDPYSRIDAENADVLNGPGIENFYIAGIQNGYSALYKNINFGTRGSTFVSFIYATPMGDASVEIRLGGPQGTLLGVCQLPSTGSWGNWATKSIDVTGITGKQDICLVFKASSYVCNLDYFYFKEDITPVRNAFSRIEAESADVLFGPGKASQWINGVQNGHYAVYNNVSFGDSGATNVKFRYSTPLNNASIEMRLGSVNGTLIGTCPLPNTGSWDIWADASRTITGTFGRQDIYLVFKGESYVCNLDYFQFFN